MNYKFQKVKLGNLDSLDCGAKHIPKPQILLITFKVAIERIDFELDMNIVLRSGCGYVWPNKRHERTFVPAYVEFV